MKISVLIPVYNEQSTIGPLVKTIKEKGYDVIVVDDGSTDDSGKIAQAQGAHVITNTNRGGKGYSLRTGFQYAIEHDYEGVLAMDGDAQHDPRDIESFMDFIRSHQAKVINGNRMVNAKGMPFIRYATNVFMSWILSIICGQRIPDSQCGFRYISTEVLKRIQLKCNDFEIESEILIRASRAGYAIYSLAVRTIYQNEKSKINPIKDAFRFVKFIFKELFTFEKR